MSTDSPGGARIETWVSSLILSPRETEKLVIYQVAELARRRRERGLELNFPESIAVITEALLEAARDGKSVADVIELGEQVLTRADVMEGVPEMVTLVQVEATFRTGTQMEVVNARAVADDKAVRPPSLQFRDLLALHGQPDRDTPACMVVAAGKPREA